MTVPMFDMPAMSPAEVVRWKGRHPVTMLPLDPDESRMCGNCGTRRWVWVHGDVLPIGDTWQLVCSVVAPAEPWCEQAKLGTGDVGILAVEGTYCEDDCCTVNESVAMSERLAAEGYDPHPSWPMEGTVEDWMPACARWSDMEAEGVVRALGKLGEGA